MKWLLTKWAINKLNKVLATYKDNVQLAMETIVIWIERLQKIIDNLKALCSRLQDNELTEEEIKDTVEDIKNTINGF